jgi:hypothetical protein
VVAVDDQGDEEAPSEGGISDPGVAVLGPSHRAPISASALAPRRADG